MAQDINITEPTVGISESIRKIAYPSPFFDISRKYIPTNIKELMLLTQYFYAISSVIHPIVNKMSEYPVTNPTYGSTDGRLKETWKKILEDNLDIRNILIETHLDYFIYGNAFLMFHEPFVRYLICTRCKTKATAKSLDYKFTYREGGKWNFNGVCPKCKTSTIYEVEDIIVRNKTKVKITKLPPMNIDIEHNEFNGESRYVYKVPQSLRRNVIGNIKIVLDTLDRTIIDAVAAGKDVLLDNDRVFHLKRPQMGTLWKGWGTPMLLPVLKDIHYYYILRKANESLALQHIVPLNVLFPQGNADVSPFQHLNLNKWRAQIEDELLKWRRDANYISILPLPIGYQQIGGQGKQMLVTQEQEMVARGIAAGLGVPIEFIIGGLSWSGSSVSLRVLENFFLNLTSQDLKLVNKFIIPKVARVFKIPKIEIGFSKFKMADDLQQKSNIYGLMQNGYVSRKTALEPDGLDSDTEITQMEKEHIVLNRVQNADTIAKQEMQNTIQIMQTRNMILAQHEGELLQKTLTEESKASDKDQMKIKISDLAEKYALTLMSQEPNMSLATLAKMQKEMPNLYKVVMEKIQTFSPGVPNQGSVVEKKAEVNVPLQPEIVPEATAPSLAVGSNKIKQAKPMPEQKPPRRTQS